MRPYLLLAAVIPVGLMACTTSGTEVKQEPQIVYVQAPAPDPEPEPEPEEVLPVEGEFECNDVFLSRREYRRASRRSSRLRSNGWLYVEAEAPDASINVEGMVGSGSVFFETGRVRYARVRVNAPGYKDFSGYVEIFEGKVRKVLVSQEVIGGSLTVMVEPFGSKVRVDGEFVGTTPITVNKLKAGLRKVLVEAPGCKETAIMIEADKNAVMTQAFCPAPRPEPPPPPPPAPEPEAAAASAPAPVPEPVAEPAPAPEPEPVVEKAPEPAPAPAVKKARPKANCKKVCARFIKAVSIESVRGAMYNVCFNRCESGDIAYSKCAWMAGTMADVANCNKMPASN